MNPHPHMNRSHGELNQASRKRRLSGVATLFIAAAAYTALPLIDLPIFGLSLSAPLFYFLALESFLRPQRRLRVRISRWGLLTAVLFLGIFVSLLINGISAGGRGFGNAEIITVVRYSYWLLVMYITLLIMARNPEMCPILVKVLVWAITLLAGLRLFEAVAYGKIGASMGLKFMTQNNYAWLFSSFAPLMWVAVLGGKKKERLTAFFQTLIVLAAVIINGSRSSWAAIAAGMGVFMLLYLQAYPVRSKALGRIFLLCGLMVAAGGLFFAFAPDHATDRVVSRFSTFEDLEMDKSYQFRKVMVQKGIKIFNEDPLFGCGLGNFRRTSVDLDLPFVFRTTDMEAFERKSSHNSYIQFLAETGLAGTVPFVVLLLVLTLKGYKAAIFLTQNGEAWALGLYVSFLTMSIHLWTLSGLTNTATWLKYGMIAGIILIGKQMRREQFYGHIPASNGGIPHQ